MGEIIKEQQVFIDIALLNNYQVLEKIKTLENKKINLIKEREEVTKTINNLKKKIDYWVEKNDQLINEMRSSQEQITTLKKQKNNKIKNFFINLFSFWKIKNNKRNNILIEIEKINYEVLKEKKINNEKKIKCLNLDYTKEKDKYTKLINNINEMLEQENKLLKKLINYQQKIAITAVNEEKVKAIQVLEKKAVTSNSDEGFNSDSTSISSLHSDTVLLKTKPKFNNIKKSNKPWEQTLRQYDYPTNNYQQKNKTTKRKIIKL